MISNDVAKEGGRRNSKWDEHDANKFQSLLKCYHRFKCTQTLFVVHYHVKSIMFACNKGSKRKLHRALFFMFIGFYWNVLCSHTSIKSEWKKSKCQGEISLTKPNKCLTFHVVDFWIWWTDFIINVRSDSISAHPLFNHVEMPNGFGCSEKNIAIHVDVFSVDRLCVPFNHKAKINGFIYKKVYF